MNDSAHATFDPLEPERGAALIAYIDFKSPYAFIAKDPTYALAAALGIRVDWRPFVLDIPSYLGSARLDAKGTVAESDRTPEQWSGVRYAYRDARRYAKLADHWLRGTTKIWDSSLAALGMLWCKRFNDVSLKQFIDITFARFWRRELDIEDLDVVLGLIAEAQAPIDGAREWINGAGRARLDDEQPRIFDAGVFGVPTYVLQREIFFGREHLPLLHWKLGGGHGAAPDIAYQRMPPPAMSVHTAGGSTS